MKIAFYLDNEKHIGIDYSKPENGNPGIGGSQYMFWIISYYLQKKYSDLDLYLFAENIDTMPSEMECIKVKDIIDVVRVADEKKLDIIVCRGPYLDRKFYGELEKTNIKCIVWSHNFENYENAKLISKCKNIKRNICVGKEQYDRLRDHNIFNKSTYIYNTITYDLYDNIENEKIPNSICFVGSLHKGKGFENLAKVWPKIEKKVPDAHLFIIGSGNLYNKKLKMGKYGLAEEKFEKKFVKYMVDDKGKIKENVHFMGVMGGKKKLELMSRMEVGIPKPGGVNETFCITAIEFEALNVPVVATKRSALIETVEDKVTGLLFKNEREFVKSVVRLIEDKDISRNIYINGSEFVKNKFNLDNIVDRWYSLLFEVYNDVEQKQNLQCDNMWNNRKWLREINRKMQKLLPFMPSVLWYESLPRMTKRMLRKVLGK